MSEILTKSERAQLEQTVELFEAIAKATPNDWQSLEILKEAYSKLGRDEDAASTARRLAEAYARRGWTSRANQEAELTPNTSQEDLDKEVESELLEGFVTEDIASPEIPEKRSFWKWW